MANELVVIDNPLHAVGDKVLWKGIPLTVVGVKPNGYIECSSPTMLVTVDTHDQLEKVPS